MDIFTPPVRTVRPRKVEVPVVAPNCVASTPPAKVEVAVVVAVMEPTYRGEVEVAERRVPSKYVRAFVMNDEAFVPPFAIPNIPETSFARSMSAVATTPAVAFKNPPKERTMREPASILTPLKVEVAVVDARTMSRPPRNVEVAVDVPVTKPVWSWSAWRPVASVDVAVTVLGIERSVVEAEFAIVKALLPEVCSSQRVTSAFGELVPKEVLPVGASMVRNAAFVDEEILKRGESPVPPWRDKDAHGEEVPMPNDPVKYELAVVVETSEPTVTWEEVAAILVPSNQRSAEERRVAFVPPLRTGRVPVTSAARLMREVAIAPAVAFKKPEMELMVNPPPVMFNPPAMVEVAVPVAFSEFVWR